MVMKACFTQAASSETGLSDEEKRFFIMKAMEYIKQPERFQIQVQLLKRKLAETSASERMKPLQLLQELEETYKGLNDEGAWKDPSEHSASEQVMALVAEQKGNKKKKKNDDKDKDSEKKQGRFARPPFTNDEGKSGDKKKWNGRTYYYCPEHHKCGHWVLHKPEEHSNEEKKPSKRPSEDEGADSKTPTKLKKTDKKKVSFLGDSPPEDEPSVQIDPEQLASMAATITPQRLAAMRAAAAAVPDNAHYADMVETFIKLAEKTQS
jgi:YHS domain-containing protein